MNQNEHKASAPPRETERSCSVHDREPVLTAAPSLRKLRGNRNSRLWGEVAALLARGPVLRDIDDE